MLYNWYLISKFIILLSFHLQHFKSLPVLSMVSIQYMCSQRTINSKRSDTALAWSQLCKDIISASAANQASNLHKYHCNTSWASPSCLYKMEGISVTLNRFNSWTKTISHVYSMSCFRTLILEAYPTQLKLLEEQTSHQYVHLLLSLSEVKTEKQILCKMPQRITLLWEKKDPARNFK